MGYSKLVVVVSVLVPFFAYVSKRISSSLTIPTVLTRRSSLPLSTFRCTKRMLSQKERVESEVQSHAACVGSLTIGKII